MCLKNLRICTFELAMPIQLKTWDSMWICICIVRQNNQPWISPTTGLEEKELGSIKGVADDDKG